MAYKNFIKHYKKYLIGDLNTMIEKADSNRSVNHNKLAIPIAMSIFSALDILGFLLRNDKKCIYCAKRNLNQSADNIFYIFKNYDFGEIHKLNKEDFMFAFRNSIAHTFFQRHFSIANNYDDTNKKIFYCDNKYRIIFNSRVFSIHFINLIDVLEDQLNNDAFLQKNFNNNIRILRKFENGKSRKIEEEIKEYFCKKEEITISTASPMTTPAPITQSRQ